MTAFNARPAAFTISFLGEAQQVTATEQNLKFFSMLTRMTIHKSKAKNQGWTKGQREL